MQSQVNLTRKYKKVDKIIKYLSKTKLLKVQRIKTKKSDLKPHIKFWTFAPINQAKFATPQNTWIFKAKFLPDLLRFFPGKSGETLDFWQEKLENDIGDASADTLLVSKAGRCSWEVKARSAGRQAELFTNFSAQLLSF